MGCCSSKIETNGSFVPNQNKNDVIYPVKNISQDPKNENIEVDCEENKLLILNNNKKMEKKGKDKGKDTRNKSTERKEERNETKFPKNKNEENGEKTDDKKNQIQKYPLNAFMR